MIKSILYTPFTGLGKFNGFRGQDWYDCRAEIFKNYTLKSLSNQANKDFLLWASFRPEEEKNPTTKKIEKYVKKAGLNYVFTFDGLMFWDDKDEKRNKTLRIRLDKSLRVIKGHIGSERYVYLTIVASDVMLAKDFIEITRKEKYKENKALFLKRMYVYDCNTKKLADWNDHFSAAFYTLMYKTKEFLDAGEHLKRQRNLTTHELIPELYSAKEIKGRKFCHIIRGTNISSTWSHPFRGKEYFYEKDKLKILKQFGL